MDVDISGRGLPRIAAAILCGAASAVCVAQEAIHSGPLPTFGGTGDRVECMVANVGSDTIFNLHVVIRSTNFGTTVEQAECPVLPPGADCTAKFAVPGPALPVRLICSAEAPGRRQGPHNALREALRGTFLRTSSEDRAIDVAVEMR